MHRTYRRCVALSLGLALLQASVAWGQAASVIKQAPPLPPPTGNVVYVSNVSSLEYQIFTATSGTTIMVQPGTYNITKTLGFANPGVTLRGATGNRDDVVIKGWGMHNTSQKRNIFWITKNDITIADLTIRDAYYHGVQIAAEYGTDRIWLRNLKILDCGERFIKGSTNNNPAYSPDDCVIEYCWLEQIQDFIIRPENSVDPENYIGGIDAMWCNRWIVRDNVFKNIRGLTGGGRGGIFLWQNCQDIVVERNLAIGCDRGISIGNPSGPSTGTYHCTNGVVRNNFVVRGAGVGVELCKTNNLKVYNNTIYSNDSSYGRTLQVDGSVTTGLKFWQNIMRGGILYTNGGTASTTGSIVGTTPAASWFVDPLNGDLRLTAAATAAIDQAVVLAEVTDDYFANPRSSLPDKGAYETPAVPPRVTGVTPTLGFVSYKDAPLTTIAITFDKDVAISAGHVSVNGLNTGPQNGFLFGYSAGSRTATLLWVAGLPNDTYEVTVSDAVTAGGVALDGEINKLSPVLPSGNGIAGGSFVCLVYRLVADANEDLAVDVVDLLTLVDTFGLSSGDAGFDATCDFNDDGAVDVVDLLTLVDNFGQTIPQQ
jgi:hypothetical protein